MPTTRTVTNKPAKQDATKSPKKPRAAAVKKTAAKKAGQEAAHKPAVAHTDRPVGENPVTKPIAKEGKYIFATGRRKTSVANIRLFPGSGETVINRKPADKYFSYSFYLDTVRQPFELTGLGNDYHFAAQVSGGGANSQAHAVRHGISIALSKISDEVRKVLKKNGLLTRDDRKKERKKPGLKRARRSPQWAKR